ncbi:hypothetical protein [Solibacillus ferritrahens]|uniref:hypothetical protein n=1 Tax=Solibacillus ferritrahens TaxID=3098620 RepID=UPI00300BBCE4
MSNDTFKIKDNPYATLTHFETEDEYRAYYITEYCNQKIYTHDGIEVVFYEDVFEHAFFKSGNRRIRGDKTIFSSERAQRIHWIKSVLLDSGLTSYVGYDNKKKCYDNSRRVTILTPDNYVVVLSLRASGKAKFITAYLCDDEDETINKIKGGPVIYQP